MLSKSRGHVLRLSAVLHLLFSITDLEEDLPLADVITDKAVEAATDFIKISCQQTAYIGGRKSLQEEIERFNKSGMQVELLS